MKTFDAPDAHFFSDVQAEKFGNPKCYVKIRERKRTEYREMEPNPSKDI
jgi:hypothetical protein